MRDFCYYNGVFTPYDSTVIPLSDRSVFFGDAVYDVMLGRNGRIYQFDEHLSRLRGNSLKLGLELLMTDEEILDTVAQLVDFSGGENFTLYIQVSGDSRRRAHVRREATPNILITITESKVPSELQEISAVILPDRRYEYCDIKTVNLLPAVLSINEAVKKEADIAIFSKNGIITECSHANISVLKDNVLTTHPLTSDILPGITRENLLKQCKIAGIETRELKFTRCELFTADAVIVSSTTQLIKICKRIDGSDLKIPARPTVSELFRALREDYLSATC